VLTKVRALPCVPVTAGARHRKGPWLAYPPLSLPAWHHYPLLLGPSRQKGR